MQEKIIEKIPERVELRIQELSNQILDANEYIVELEKANLEQQKEFEVKCKEVIALQREVIALNKEIKRAQCDFNCAEKKYLETRQLAERLKKNDSGKRQENERGRDDRPVFFN